MTDYIRDGHRLYLRFETDGEIHSRLWCPVPEILKQEDATPLCYTASSEDGTEEILGYCNIKEWFANGALGDYLHTEEAFNITRIPVPIEWAFIGDDLHIRPYDPTAGLPAWDEMTDLDKGALVMFAHKCGYEGYEYAAENYPVKYLEDPRLTALDQDDANDHAYEVIEELDGEELEAVPADEKQRLYELAAAEEEHRRKIGARQ